MAKATHKPPNRRGRSQPQYHTIRADMVRRIEAGEWVAGEAIPSLNELEHLYPASRMTILRVMHLLEEEGYVRVEHGSGTYVRQRLPGRRVGILCGDNIFSVPQPPFTAAVCGGLSTWLEKAGYQPRIYVVESYEQTDSCYPNHALALDVKRELTCALALISTEPLPDLLADAANRGLPVADCGANVLHPAHVTMDTETGIGECVRWLAEHGRNRIALISGTQTAEPLFRRACAQGGLTPMHHPALTSPVPPGNTSPIGDGMTEVNAEEHGFLQACELFARPVHPDAVIVTDDVMAKGVAQALLARGVRVPENLTLVAMGNSGVPMFYPVPLVSYEYDTGEIVNLLGCLLTDQLQGKSIVAPQPVRGHFRERLGPPAALPLRRPVLLSS